ncbi:MAG TPA: hypothetical protein VHI52_12195 [Verrucomicrobiae bacterium]|nr:hypothetical protein [Verrucomicrobiae bacterium]
MKTIPSLRPVFFALIAIFFAATPQAQADPAIDAATALLTDGSTWRVQGKDWYQDMTFAKDGSAHITFAMPGDASLNRAGVSWRADHFHITLTYIDHQVQLDLPIDPAGSHGKDGKGFDVTFTRIKTPKVR